MIYEAACPTNGTAFPNTHLETALPKCFCYSGHSAFNFHCDHYKKLGFPSALFLVSRKFRDAATKVFYGTNSFVVTISRTLPKSSGGNISTMSGRMRFPERFPKYAIRFIHRLIFEFNPSEIRMFGPGTAGWENWLDTMELLSKHSNLAILNLEIRLEENLYAQGEYIQVIPDTDSINWMLDAYQKLVQPVTALRGLNNFFVHTNWGTSCIGDGQALDGGDEVERKLEEMVMGVGYDAWFRGKVWRMDFRY